MQLFSDDVLIHRFVPDDGNSCAAVRVTHRTEHTEVVNEETVCPRENLRRSLRQLLAALNPHPDHIGRPALYLHDDVIVLLPTATHDGKIVKMMWDFTTREWQYFVACKNHNASRWYVLADLELFEEA